MATVGIVRLGCPRNLVDSEVIAGALRSAGYSIVEPDRNPDIYIINTCSFITSAKEESIDAVLEASRLKREGAIKHLVVAGCLGQLYGNRLLRQVPEIDLVVGTGDFPGIASLLKRLGRNERQSIVSPKPRYLYDERAPRKRFTPRHWAYVKIAEGCDNRCSYCIISKVRGSLRSRTIPSVVSEVKRLARGGAIREIDLIGQDTTRFGVDRSGRSELPELLRRIAGLKNDIAWIRLLYTHPAHYTDELISVIGGEEKICAYLDLPIQHATDRILRAMHRRTTRKEIVALIEKLRKRVPGLVLRTSLIVGFPGETDREFTELLDFVRRTRFDKLGVFTYSREEGTKASRLPRQVPERVKQERLDAVMRLQQVLSAEIQRSFLGKTVTVLIDEALGDGRFCGRTFRDAPEIDGLVYVSGKGLRVGAFSSVKITDALEYDLVGETV